MFLFRKHEPVGNLQIYTATANSTEIFLTEYVRQNICVVLPFVGTNKVNMS